MKISKKSVAMACMLAWLIPGAGHAYVGCRWRGVVLFVLIVGLFAAGILMNGGVLSDSTDFVSRLCMAGRLGVGLPWLAALGSRLREGNMLSPFGEIGACYTTVAGLLNVLVVMSAKDVVRKTGP